MRKNQTVAVVVTHNRKDLLRQNLRCLLEQEGAPCDILLVDNASTDGTREMVESEFGDAQVTYFNTGTNLGGAGGFHIGLFGAVILGYKYAWAMDDDCLPSPNALSELLKAGEMLGDWGFLSSAVYWTDGSLCKANRPKRDLFRHVGDADLGDGPKRVLMGSFVSMLVPTSVVREVGLPIAEYFIWTDDYEFSGRVSRLHPCYFVPKSEVTHAMAKNSRADIVTAEGERAKRFRTLFRNDVHCYRQYGIGGWAYLISKGLYTIADIALHAQADKAKRVLVLLGGYRAGLDFDPATVSVSDARRSPTTALRLSVVKRDRWIDRQKGGVGRRGQY